MSNFITYVSLVVGCVVGIGFVSGTEVALYIGCNAVNYVIFAVTFATILAIITHYCNKNGIDNVEMLTSKLFNKTNFVVTLLLLVCYFASLSTLIAGAESCLQSITEIRLPLPVFSVALCVTCAVIIVAGNKCVKIISTVALPVVVIFVVYVLLFGESSVSAVPPVSPIKPVQYAVANAVLSLGVTTKIKVNKPTVFAIVTSATITALAVITCLCVAKHGTPLTYVHSVTGKCIAFVAVTSATVTSVNATAEPIITAVCDVIGDKVTSTACVFVFALATSLVGFDVIVQYAYPFITTLTALVILLLITKKLRLSKRIKNRN